MKKVTAVCLGAGGRGNVYSRYQHECPEEFQIAAVAEPDRARREQYCQEFGVPPHNAFESWEALLARPRMADAALVCTMDTLHTAPAIRALELGYHVLLEKPMATTEQECAAITRAAGKEGLVLSVCHVLRYAPFYSTIKEVLQSGKIGAPLVVQQIENVGYWHQAHSFVRGNWRNTAEACPMILAKCCHDLDIINWLLEGFRCRRVSSFGALTHFKAENAPAGAPARCLEGCPARDTCPYYAPRFYLEHPLAVSDGFTAAVTTDGSRQGILQALETSPYGRCVYHCDNNVVDHQAVNLEYEGAVVASLIMTAFTEDCNRTLKMMGTRGELAGDMNRDEITVRVFGAAGPERVAVRQPAVQNNFHHGGGDYMLMRDFVAAVCRGDPSLNRSSAAQSLRSHRLCFAAEHSRLTGETIELEELG